MQKLVDQKAKWVRAYLDPKENTFLHIFPEREKIDITGGKMYQDCTWSFEDGVFRLEGTLRNWEYIRNRCYAGDCNWKDNVYDEIEAEEKYENPKFELKTYRKFWLFGKKAEIKIWQEGKYLLKERKQEELLVKDNIIMFIIKG